LCDVLNIIQFCKFIHLLQACAKWCRLIWATLELPQKYDCQVKTGWLFTSRFLLYP